MERTAILEVEGLSCRFGGVTALNDVTLALRRGEFRCVIGPNGAGKTTFVNAITGIVKSSEGRVRLDGEPLNRRTPARLARAGVLRTFQTPRVFGALTVAENFALAARFDRAFEERGRSLREDLGFTGREQAIASQLSQGERKRLEIGMAFMRSPRVILLDEPTAGMSGAETREVAFAIRKYGSEAATVIIEHDMGFVREIADTVSVLHRGSLLMEGTLDEVQADQRVRDIYLGSGVH